MEELASEILKRIIIQFGSKIINEPDRLKALLNDFCGRQKREINLITSALSEKIPDELLNNKRAIIDDFLFHRLVQRLCENEGMTDDAANWAVTTWAIALGKTVSTSPRPRNPPPPLPPPPPQEETPTALGGSLMEEIVQAINQRKAVVIKYQNQRGFKTMREITPLKLYSLSNRQIYIMAWCTTSYDWRTFRMDRVMEAYLQEGSQSQLPPLAQGQVILCPSSNLFRLTPDPFSFSPKICSTDSITSLLAEGWEVVRAPYATKTHTPNSASTRDEIPPTKTGKHQSESIPEPTNIGNRTSPKSTRNRKKLSLYLLSGTILLVMIVSGTILLRYITIRKPAQQFPALGITEPIPGFPIRLTLTPTATITVTPKRSISNAGPAQSTSTSSSTVFLTPTQIRIKGCAILNLNIRDGPGVNFVVIDWLLDDQCIFLDARTVDSEWLRIAPKQTVKSGWITASKLTLTGSADLLPTLTLEESPTPTSQP